MRIHLPSRSRAAVARTLPELTAALAGRDDVALVPTMGALHEGHRALLRAARRSAGTVVMSLFVNPTQFGPGEDFARYPRDEEADVAVARQEGADVVFAPTAQTIYPEGFAAAVDPGPLAGELEGRSRPGHFRGVATVVTRLFGLVRPQHAFFGEKDYQQLVIVRGVARDLALGTEVVGVPTVRDADGLALSSRNGKLTAGARAAALSIPRALATRDAERARAVLAEAGLQPDYVEVADLDGPTLAIAVRIGSVRLIDNVLLEGDPA
jgi:pantoate--beta-alanine ligase